MSVGRKISLALLVIVGLVAAVWRYKGLGLMPIGSITGTPSAEMPSKAPDNTAVVFNLEARGDKDARLYAIGFARAFADRLLCAPSCLVQQPSTHDLQEHLNSVGAKPGGAIPDDLAKTLAARMGAKYAVTGDFALKGDLAKITLRVIETSADSKPLCATIIRAGKLSDLPQMQIALVQEFLKATKLPGHGSGRLDLASPNFSSHETLRLYARSCLAATYEESEALRWQAWDTDQQSLFPVFRLIELYMYGPATIGDIQSEPRLPKVIATARKHHADNTFLDVLSALLLDKQCRYREAQGILEAAVKRDPGMARAHDALAYTASCRGDADLAVKEAKAALSLWSSRPYSHLRMADAHQVAAGNARRGRYFGAMSRSARDTWESHSEEGFRETQIAAAIDPDIAWAWSNMLVFARELGHDREMHAAFKELVRINPRNIGAYEAYAFSFSPQWGGSPGEQENVYRQAEQVFGTGSTEMCVLRGWTMLSNSDRAQNREEILRLVNEGISKAKDPGIRDRAIHLKCSVLMGLKRKAEMLEVARKAFDQCPSMEWRMQLAKGYQYRYEDSGDRVALDKAAQLLKVYVEEIPFNPNGHVQYGWCLSHQGRPDLARREFETALKIDPQNELAKEKMKYVQ